ncbi:glycosyltransferase family 2 protein [Rhizorhapis suberifaciens]|uniref:Glycosyltransferase involved in cell wall biosynthesis n=1 Tax=Rhizorhapis suberifaciens TaxID=13656 RepID=A0A840HR79_9SPHN|nr:glycosyltransferase family 2 protein [Rhizorhapis suberifaciens]MBB4640612.1 glycosyltransferase involved in cell wall biosynthesis [Rhizorhapis suberifaciens]
MKLIIQIPCLNEEDSLPEALAALPRHIPGIDKIEWLIINDGSVDRTVEVALEHGVDHVVDLPVNRGLAYAFMAGLKRSLAEGADIIVNTDADNQYNADDIPLLIKPILERRAQMVIGDRPISTIAHFSWIKRKLQWLGTKVVRMVSQADIHDAPSGFRAIARTAALEINVFDSYTYTLESIIQAGLSNIPIISVPIRVNGETRPSRLLRSMHNYVWRSIKSIARTFFIYKPGMTFFYLSLPPLITGAGLVIRWMALFAGGTERSHVPSLVAASCLLMLAMLMWTAGLLGEQLLINRRMVQDLQLRIRDTRAPAYDVLRDGTAL